MTVVLVAIVGGSASGKSWLAETLRRRIGIGSLHVFLDDFYRDLSHLPFGQRERINFDQPRAIDWRTFGTVLRSLRRGRSVDAPEYDFATHTRRAGNRRLEPKPLILVEGLWLLRTAALRKLFDYSIFVECAEPLRLARRLARDTRERGRSRDGVLRQFREQVAPMHERFVACQTQHARSVLPSPVSAGKVNALICDLKAVMNRKVARPKQS